ncbi:hypothetical protein BDP55DRAFT_640697 [Colletotrichum godetiae]|uniref:Uncharacterized protein n=1 Tax=Colletotrichum godetiae TaxID=1209918 RepID=A0AAJ0AZH8_9PEZI|nr:uncharacterized protein BDP55DRAFT_640697 [Colletotrichum godetiae]KAK1701171.1 hypothetical protein BDP55DRAFT_640697 [Colletotrichum godetiae]
MNSFSLCLIIPLLLCCLSSLAASGTFADRSFPEIAGPGIKARKLAAHRRSRMRISGISIRLCLFTNCRVSGLKSRV